MTEEEARPENTEPKTSQPEAKLESHKSLTDRISSFFTTPVSFKQTKEQKTMANNEETTPENTQSSLQAIFHRPCNPANLPKTAGTPAEAEAEFNQIKKALVGPKPEWCLPEVDFKATKTVPAVNNTVLRQSCKRK
jgi:hypothetical protein